MNRNLIRRLQPIIGIILVISGGFLAARYVGQDGKGLLVTLSGATAGVGYGLSDSIKE